MKSKVHMIAGLMSVTCIAGFWSSTLVSELFLSHTAVAAVKAGIVDAFVLFIPLMIMTAGTGFAMGGQSTQPLILAKRRRMPLIGLNGLLVMIPAAFFLSGKAGAGEFDGWFYGVQTLELLAGAANLFLMGLNIRDGMRSSGRLAPRPNASQI